MNRSVLRPDVLPKGFEALEDHVADWGNLITRDDRYLMRQSLPMERLRSFYDAAIPHLESIFRHLDQHPYGQLPEQEQRLFRLALALVEVAQAVEVFEQSGVPFTAPNHRVQISPIPTPRTLTKERR
jgi:hypothetical protein